MTLVDFLKSNKDARKIFGKRELKIIEKQVNGEVLSQSERNRLSRDIRKKLEFIREVCRFSNEFNLKHGSAVKEMIEEAVKIMKESRYFPRIKKIVLFGSTAENKRSYRSDVDIAVEFDSIDTKEATEFRIKTHVNDKIDLQVYNILPDKIKKEIDKSGKILYEK